MTGSSALMLTMVSENSYIDDDAEQADEQYISDCIVCGPKIPADINDIARNFIIFSQDNINHVV